MGNSLTVGVAIACVLGKGRWPPLLPQSGGKVELVALGGGRPGALPSIPTPESSGLSFLEDGVLTAGQLWHLPEGLRPASCF